MSTLGATEVELEMSVLTSPANRIPDDGLAGPDVARAARSDAENLYTIRRFQARNTAEATGRVAEAGDDHEPEPRLDVIAERAPRRNAAAAPGRPGGAGW